MSKAQTLRHR